LPFVIDKDDKVFLLSGDKRVPIDDLDMSFSIKMRADRISEERAMRRADDDDDD